MANLIPIKLKIGELITKYENAAQIDKCIDFDYNGNYACISFHKSPINPSISIEVTTNDIVYKFLYPSNKSNHFDMSELKHLTSIESVYND